MTIKDNGDGTFSVVAPSSFNKPKVTVTSYKDKIMAITMTDDDHKITDVLWERQTPLTDDEIIQTACNSFYGLINKNERDNFVRFARAIENAHGIK